MQDYELTETVSTKVHPRHDLEARQADRELKLQSVRAMDLGPPDAEDRGISATVIDARAVQPSRAVNSILYMQRRYGNRYVQRALAVAEKTPLTKFKVDSSLEEWSKSGAGTRALVQRECACGGHTASGGECEDCCS